MRNSTKLLFYIPYELCKMGARTFSNKEPEISELIDKFGDNRPFWGIGSNIGLYSIYFVKKHKGKVYSFEPSFFNLKQLAKNININNVSKQINIIPLPLPNLTGFNELILSDAE